MRRHGHYNARAVVQDDIVRKVERDFFLCERIDYIFAGEHALFFYVRACARNLVQMLNLGDELSALRLCLAAGDDLLGERTLGSHNHECGAVECVGSGGVNREHLVTAVNLEVYGRALALAYPVCLHGLYLVGPALEFVYVGKESVGIIGDLKEPLFKILLAHGRLAAFALAVDNLFVRKHGLTGRTPVYILFFLVCEVVFVQLKEHPLRPLVVIGHTGFDLSVPIIAYAHGFKLSGHVLYIGESPFFRSDAVLDCRILRREAERIVTHGVQHIVAVHGLEPCHNIAYGIVAHMTHVQIARRIGEHLKRIVFRLGAVLGHFESAVLLPFFLPFLFYLCKIIIHAKSLQSVLFYSQKILGIYALCIRPQFFNVKKFP